MNAAAQDDGSVSAASPGPASGYRIEDPERGFKLVTHGVWRSPEPLPSERSSTAMVSGTPGAMSRQGSKRPQGAAPSFRRAAYLPHVYAAEAQYGQLALLVLQSGSKLSWENVVQYIHKSIDVIVQLSRSGAVRTIEGTQVLAK